MKQRCPRVVLFKRIFTVQSSASPVFEVGLWSCFSHVKFSLEEAFLFLHRRIMTEASHH